MKGWKYEGWRHSLAAKGVQTVPRRYNSGKNVGKKYYYTPTYVASDLPLIGTDALGTVGAASVELIPVAVSVLAVYGGAKLVKKWNEKGKKKGE